MSAQQPAAILEALTRPPASATGTKRRRCFHVRNSWILGGLWQWCYRCGALQRLKPTGPNACVPDSGWLRPVGPEAANPGELPPRRGDCHGIGKWRCGCRCDTCIAAKNRSMTTYTRRLRAKGLCVRCRRKSDTYYCGRCGAVRNAKRRAEAEAL